MVTTFVLPPSPSTDRTLPLLPYNVSRTFGRLNSNCVLKGVNRDEQFRQFWLHYVLFHAVVIEVFVLNTEYPLHTFATAKDMYECEKKKILTQSVSTVHVYNKPRFIASLQRETYNVYVWPMCFEQRNFIPRPVWVPCLCLKVVPCIIRLSLI